MIGMQGDFFLSELSIGWLESLLLNCILIVLNVAEFSQALTEPYAGDITLSELFIGWVDFYWIVKWLS